MMKDLKSEWEIWTIRMQELSWHNADLENIYVLLFSEKAANHYLNQYLPIFMTLKGVFRLQCELSYFEKLYPKTLAQILDIFS